MASPNPSPVAMQSFLRTYPALDTDTVARRLDINLRPAWLRRVAASWPRHESGAAAGEPVRGRHPCRRTAESAREAAFAAQAPAGSSGIRVYQAPGSGDTAAVRSVFRAVRSPCHTIAGDIGVLPPSRRGPPHPSRGASRRSSRASRLPRTRMAPPSASVTVRRHRADARDVLLSRTAWRRAGAPASVPSRATITVWVRLLAIGSPGCGTADRAGARCGRAVPPTAPIRPSTRRVPRRDRHRALPCRARSSTIKRAWPPASPGVKSGTPRASPARCRPSPAKPADGDRARPCGGRGPARPRR